MYVCMDDRRSRNPIDSTPDSKSHAIPFRCTHIVQLQTHARDARTHMHAPESEASPPPPPTMLFLGLAPALRGLSAFLRPL